DPPWLRASGLPAAACHLPPATYCLLLLPTAKSLIDYVGLRFQMPRHGAEPLKSLRSSFEPGSPREAVRRAQWKALGLTNEDMLKPKIAVVNSSSELAICFSHLDGIAKV